VKNIEKKYRKVIIKNKIYLLFAQNLLQIFEHDALQSTKPVPVFIPNGESDLEQTGQVKKSILF
jgi:hypothetical protein